MGAGSIGASASGMTGALAPERRVDTAPDLELTLPARPENVAVARHAIGGVAGGLQGAGPTPAHVQLAVTEGRPDGGLPALPEGGGPAGGGASGGGRGLAARLVR